MKKTSFTQLHKAVSKHLAWLAFVCLTLCSLSLEAQIPACSSGSVTPASPGTPAVDASCSHATPDVITAAVVVPPPGFTEFASRLQAPIIGSPVSGTGPHTIFVDVIFHEIGNPMNMCVIQTTVTYNAMDNLPPMGGNCTQVMGGVLIDIDPAGPCTVTLDDAFLRANMFNPGAPTDNCTASADLILQSSIPSAGPLGCADPNPRTFNFVLRVIDEAGNMQDCNTAVQLRDVEAPIVTFDPAFGGGTNYQFEEPMTNGCGGMIPDMSAAVTSIMDNCDGTPAVTQNPVAGSNALGAVLIDPATGCLVMVQSITVTVTDCFGNPVSQGYQITYRDETPAQFIDPTQVCALAMNDLDYPAGPLVADGTCMVMIPDLSDEAPILGNINDNCNSTSIRQDPPPGPYDVSGNCPPNTTIDVTFTPVDCDGNEGTPVTCPALLSFTDMTPPVITCPADPITVVVPFDGATCAIGMAMVDLALLTAEGVTVTDACDPMPVLTNVSPNMFTCSDIGKAGLTVTIDAEDCFGNPAVTTTCAVEVVPDSDLTAAWSIAGGDFTVCPGAPDFPIQIVLGANTPSCGVWSGDVAVNGTGPFTIDESSFPDLDGDGFADAGSYSVTYTVGPVGCHAEITHNIMVSPEFSNGDAALTPDFSICWEMGETFDLGGLLASATINGAIDGAQEVPPSGSAGTGSISGSLNPSTGALEITVNFAGLGSNVTAAHIHNAPAGSNGPVMFDLVALGFPTGVTSGTFTGSVTLSSAQVTAIQAGNFYVNIHTTGVPSGEIRGQIATSGGAVPGGAFTIALGGGATGTLNGSLFQYNGGDGTLTVTYTLTDCDSDTESDQVVITIDEKPDGHFTLAADMCQDAGIVTPNVTGVPAGASVAFTSSPAGFVTNATTGEFNPSAGPLAGEFVDVTVTMTVSNGVCADYTITQIVRVYESGNPAFSIPATICEADAPLTLQLTNPNNDGGANPVTDANVTWTGTSVGDLGATGTFDPSVGPGVYTICVTVGAPSCEEQQCHDIEVLPDYTDADVALIDNFDVCAVNDQVISFDDLLDVGALHGGVWSGSISVSGTLVGTINPSSFEYNGGCGVLTVSYSFPDDCLVPTVDVVSITFEQKPDVGGLVLGGPYCVTDGEVFIDYSGTPEICGTLGVFSGAGVTDLVTGTTALFDPAAAGESADFTEHEITYTLASPTGICADVVAVGVIQVDAASPTDFTLQSEACANEVVALALDAGNASVLPGSPDGNVEVQWFGGDGLNAVVTDNGDGTGTFVGYVSGTYNVCVRTGDANCSQFECQQITVDITPPVLNCNDFVRTRPNATGVCTYNAIGTEFDVTATDNCSPPNGAPVLTHNYAPWIGTPNTLAGATFPVGITQVMWTATDTAGNSSSCTIEIVINDTENPTVQSCPTSFSQGTDADICGANISYVIPQFADNCDGTNLEGVLISGYAPGTDFPVGVTTVTWTYTDLADNGTATCSFTVTVNDDDNPTPICSPAYAVSLDGDGQFDVLATDINNASYDNCTVVSTLISRTGAAPFTGSVTMTCADVTSSPVTVTLQVTDQAGLTSTCTTAVTVNDDQTPDIECAGNITVVAMAPACAAVVNYPAPTVTDNCSFTVMQTDGTGLTSGSSFPVGTTVQTYKVTDIAGNMESCTFNVIVLDEVAPTIDCGPSVRTRTADLDMCSFFMAGAGFDAVGADNCGAVTITHNYPYALDPNTLAGTSFPVGSTTVTWIATDASGNQSAICGIEIVVTDDQDPTIDCGSGAPANVLTNPSFEAGGPFDTQGADNWTQFGPVFRLFQSVSPAFFTHDGNVMMKTFGGAAGLFQDFPVIVGDQLNGSAWIRNASFDPIGANQFAVIKFEFLNAANGIISVVESPQFTAANLPTDVWTEATLSAIVPAGTVNARFVVVSVTLSGGGAVMFDDANVTVGAGGSSGNVTVSNDPGDCGADVSLNAPISDDNCGIVSIINDYNYTSNASDSYPVGTTNVGWTVTDAAGNTAECIITVTVTDDEKPVYANCPTTMVMIGNDPDQCSGKLNWSIPVATDNCGIATNVQTAGPANGTPIAIGVPMTVTYTATDIHGNTETCSFQVQVVDTQKPEFDADIVMPANVTVQCDAVPAPFVLTLDDVNDNCPGPLTIMYTQTSTQNPNQNVCGHYNYTITRTWTVTDVAGNQRIHVQVITVVDTTPPVPVCQNATVTLDKFGVASLDPLTVINGTTDNCAPLSALTVTANPATFNCNNLGANPVVISVADPCGNTANCNITVTVVEGPAPCVPEAALATSCLNNATTLTNGQFAEVITLKSLAMQTWTLTSSTGLYTATSAAPPAAPTAIPNGTVLNAGTGANMIFYTLNARFVEGIGYSATFTNNLGQTVTVTNVAFYPTPVINNLDDQLCISTPAFVPDVTDQFAGAGAYVSIQYFVDGVQVTQIDPATLGYGQHLLTVVVDANGFTPSTYVNGVNVPGTAVNAAASRLDPGCVQSYSEYFIILETPTQVTCNNLIQVTLDPNCSSTVTPDMVLEGTYPCFDDYSVHITLLNGVPLSPPNVVTGAHAGLTLPYTLQHPISGNACWGHIKVEDKTAPVVTCPADVQILCTADPDSIVFWLPPNHPCFPARDFFGKLVPTSGQLLYYGQPSAVDCSDWTWEYTDDYTVYNCAQNSGLIALIERTFVVTDEFGNQGTCIQTIERLRGEFGDIDFPADLDIACNDPILNSLAPGFAPQILEDLYDNQCGGNTQGWPEIDDHNLTTTGTGACGLGITYTDEIVNICAESYKVVRTWKVHDWCPAGGGAPTVNTHVQYIKVDNIAPTISIDCQSVDPVTGYCILNATEPGNMPHTPCSAIYIPFAQVDGGCDNVVEVTVETPEGFTTNGGLIPAPGLPLGGPYDLVYRAEDQCGNITEFVLTVVVQDKTAPITVCDEITDVNLSADGLAVVNASVFDDGSYDGCCLDEFLVRRMVDNCGIPSDLDFGPHVTFCCADVGPDPIMVVFRAVDCNGNYNDCMVQVNVSDKIPPILISCPAGQRRTCDWYADNLETQLAAIDANQNLTAAEKNAEKTALLAQYFGSPEFIDNCNLNLNPTVSTNIDQCLEGTITRQWKAQDPSGNMSQTCTQTINIDHVSDWVIEFPADVTVTCGNTVPNFGEPEIFFETCELVAVSFDDVVYTTVPDACYKIVRQWTVINWCVVGQEIDQEVIEQPENALGLPFPQCDLDGDGDCDARTFRDSWRSGTPANLRRPTAADATRATDPDSDPDSDPWDGYITYQQTIKVIDNVDPVFTNGCAIPDVCISGTTCEATINLPTPDVDDCSNPFITFTVTGDLGTGTGPFFNVAPGTYNVKYVAKDNCNNQTECLTTVKVVDCKKPTPYCKNGLVIELMDVDPAMVQVWASDFDAGSFDNCPGDLQLSFSANVNETGRLYTCGDLGQQTVQMWVTDAAGNQDFCETFVIIQANMGQCTDPQQQNTVAGLINTEQSVGVSDVDVQLSGTNQMSVMTDGTGMFSFNVATGGDYTVTPVKDDEPLNGVTTFDLVLITKHILGVQPLNSPYKLIAADANKSNSVTTFDLVQLRKLILFIDLDFPNNTSWRFVDKDFVFSNPANPWATAFPEVVSFNNISANQLAADFVAVKVGDVNGSAQPNLTSGSTDDRNAVGSLVFNVDDTKLKVGETYTVDFKAQDFDVQGYQFTLNFDRNALEFVEVASAVAGGENFGLALLDKGAITASWNDDNVFVANGETVFSLVFKATADVKLSNVLNVNSRYTKAEAYQQDGELLDIALAFNGQTVAGFDLYQNTPNPFSTNTIIGFNLPEATAATMTISDVSGKIVKVVKGNYAKGYNEIKLQRSEVPATGILYYQLDTDTDSATKMMLLID